MTVTEGRFQALIKRIAGIEKRCTAERLPDASPTIKWFKKSEWWLVILSAVAAVFAGCSAWIFEGQLQEMHTASVLDQRAWVGAIQDNPPVGGILPIRICNTGKTPALEVSSAASGAIVYDRQYIEKPPSDSLDGTIQINKGLMMPGANQFINSMISDVQPNQVIEIRGTISYSDIFGKKHWTRFCFAALGPGNRFRFCTHGNDTDDHPLSSPPSLRIVPTH